MPQKWVTGRLEGHHHSGSNLTLRHQKLNFFFSELGPDHAVRNGLMLPKDLGDWYIKLVGWGTTNVWQQEEGKRKCIAC